MLKLLPVLLFVIGCTSEIKAVYHTEKDKVYEVIDCEGWTLRVYQGIQANKNWPIAHRLISNQLFQMKLRLNDEVIGHLQKVIIYVDSKHEKLGGAEYHPDKEWLINNNFSPLKAQTVEISDIEGLIKDDEEMPNVMLHELIHAYHHQVLKFENQEIIDAYNQAIKAGKYQKVLASNGKMYKHYASSDNFEYFAEAAEAYFGVNDFYPFTKGELMGYDPEICKILKKMARPANTLLQTNPAKKK